MSGTNSADDVRRYQEPYSGHRPVPTISRYREELALRQQEAMEHDETPAPAADEGLAELRPSRSALPTGPRPSTGLSIRSALSDRASRKSRSRSRDKDERLQELPMIDTSQTDPALTDPRRRRKELGTKGKEKGRQRAEREVTDPVTHQTIIIQDFDDDALENVTFNDAATLAPRKSMSSSRDEPNSTKKPTDAAALHQEFPVPDFGGLRDEIEHISRQGATVGVFGAAIILIASYEIYKLLPASTKQGSMPWLMFYGGFFLMAYLAIFVRDYSSRQTRQLFEDEIWHAHREKMKTDADKSTHERTVWLNSVLRTLWPIINPDLFASFTDILEDVMQASIPKIVRMVSIEDIGQGSEPLRILGIRWLPSGATSETLRPKDGSGKDDNSKTKEKDAAASNPFGPHVMDDEEGSFVNLEISFAYRTRASSRMAKHSHNDLHLFVAFYLPGNIKIPVWVNLHGIIGTIRARLQLIADPPFISLCTVTLMGQPKVAMSCVPLVQRGLNIMDVPLISNFVQAAVDAAVAQYVAPKSLTIDLQKILVGEDFKKNTLAKGILMVTIKRGYDFKMGDAAIPFFREGGSDPYVSVGWAKFGKVVWSSRIMYKEMSPCWDETCFVLVTPEELNIDERLRVQLWDSDRFTADDDLGRIEVSLKEIMESPESKGKMSDRADGFRALKSGDDMPGKLEWSVGYFPKTKILDSQFQVQTRDRRVRNMEQLNKKVQRTCERKLREAMLKDTTLERHEEDLEKKRVLEFKMEHDEMIISAPPPEEYPSGLLSIQIHNLTGLEVKKLSKEPKTKFGSASDDEEETGEGLPSSYCTILINHRKTFKSRVKPQNSKPFFNAGCERFIRDWRDCEVYVSVRDARLHEDDPLLGIVHLPLAQVFKQRSQVMGWWPISGGIGNGRIRISLVWRSVSLQAPRNLLGWQYGTLDIRHKAIGTGVPEELRSCKLRLQTNISTGKMYSSATEDGHAIWATRSSKHVALALHQRYSSCFSITFVDGRRLLGDRIAAYCVLWLKDIPDEEEQEIDLPIWKGDYKRAMSNCMETCGDKMGTLKLRLTLWAGMGSAHTSWASGSEHLRQVVEVIDTARDILQTDDLEKEMGIVDADNNGDQDGDSSDDEGADNDAETEEAKSQHQSRRGRKGSSPGRDVVLPDGSISDKQSMLDQVRDYKKKAKTLHRQHRGIMQWKIPRTAKWVKNKLGRVEDGVSGLFEHDVKRKADIETEV
ncbi:hypothetical protein MY1884_002312 [Beauveria asiatica]